MKINFKREELIGLSLQDFYILTAEKADIDTVIGSYDCRYIWISKEIQDVLFEEYRKRGNSDTQTAMMFLMCGPKADSDLSGFTARIENGFYYLPYPETIVTDEVNAYYEKEVPASAKRIDIYTDPICILTGDFYHRLTWSSDYCETEDCSYLDYQIYDMEYQDVDSGLYAVPDKYDNLIDAFDYMIHMDPEFEPYVNQRDDWKLIDEEVIDSLAQNVWEDKVNAIKPVYTHNVAAEIVDIFDDFLRKHDMMVPSEDKEEEKDRNFPENDAALYGSEYDDILSEIEEHIIQLLKKHKVDMKSYVFK